MYDHIGLKVSDLAKSVRFYKAALGALGYELCSQDEAGASFGPAKAPALWLSVAKGSTGPGVHIAFRAAGKLFWGEQPDFGHGPRPCAPGFFPCDFPVNFTH